MIRHHFKPHHDKGIKTARKSQSGPDPTWKYGTWTGSWDGWELLGSGFVQWKVSEHVGKTIGQLYNNGGNIWRYWKIIGKIVQNFWDSFGLYLVNSLKGDMIILQGIIIFHGKRYSNYFDLLNEETSQRIPRSSHGGWTNWKIQNITDSAHLRVSCFGVW